MLNYFQLLLQYIYALPTPQGELNLPKFYHFGMWLSLTIGIVLGIMLINYRDNRVRAINLKKLTNEKW